MEGLVCCLRFTGAPIGKCITSVALRKATSRRASHPSGCYQERHKQLWEDLVPDSSGWWDAKVGKRCENSQQPLKWLNPQYEPIWVYPPLATGDASMQGSSVEAERYSLLASSCPGAHELETFCEEGQLDKAFGVLLRMDQQGIVPSEDVYTCLLKACTNRRALMYAKRVHTHMAGHGLEVTRFLGECLVSTLVRCGDLEVAVQVFCRLSERTVFSWTALIDGYSVSGQGHAALRMYRWMQLEAVEPNTYTFVSLLKACGSIPDLDEGKHIHADIAKYNCGSDYFVGSCLVDMYAKCGSLVDAWNVFEGLSQRNVVSWNVMLAAYARHGHGEKALQLYEQMWEDGMSPSNRTFVIVLQACAVVAENENEVVVDGRLSKARALEKGKAIHARVRRKGYDSDVFVGSTLIGMYGKCGSMVDAQNVFDGLSQQRNLVTWTAMVAAYVEQGLGDRALQLYRQMQEEGVSPDEVTLVCILQACSDTGSLEVCNQIHRSLVSRRQNYSCLLANTLIHAYGRCASMVDAQAVFDALPQPDVVSWTTLIAGYAREGKCTLSFSCYEEMQLLGTKPDGLTFLSLLSACSHAGLVNKGIEYFQSMSQDHGIAPELEHYISIVDLLGRAGYFIAVKQLLLTMPMQPDLGLYLCLLGACRNHGVVDFGKEVFDRATQLDPRHSSAYLLMWNIYADAGLWDRAQEVKERRQDAGAWKKRGQSWIQHEKEIHNFAVGDQILPQQEQLYELLGYVNLELRGYIVAQMR